MTTMEECIMMSVGEIRTMLNEATDQEIDPSFKDSIKVRLDSIEKTLEEGDPQ
jgi:hypothetical protein